MKMHHLDEDKVKVIMLKVKEVIDSGEYVGAWDYLPGSRQWRCRDTGGARGGEFVPSSECSSQQQVDNWP